MRNMEKLIVRTPVSVGGDPTSFVLLERSQSSACGVASGLGHSNGIQGTCDHLRNFPEEFWAGDHMPFYSWQPL